MINDSTGIVKNALLEASLRRIRLIEAMDYPDITTDESYDNKIFDLRINPQYHNQIKYLKIKNN